MPFVIGGRIAAAELLLVISAVGCSLCWALHQFTHEKPQFNWTGAELLLVAILGIGLLQTISLPPELIAAISPEIKTLLPLWNSSEGNLLGSWNFLSLAVGETRQALVIGASYVMLFWATAQRIQRVSEVQRLLKAICLIAALMSAFGLLQYLTANGKFYWFFEYPGSTTADRIKGAFTNKNHFAAFLTLAIGPFIWWLLDTSNRDDSSAAFGSASSPTIPRAFRIALIGGGGGLVAVGLLSSLSRGAFVAGGCGLAVMLLVMYLRSMISLRVLGGMACLAIVAGGLQLAVGYEQMMNRLNRWDDNGRMQIWMANLQVVSDFPWLGTGVGSHRHIHLRYLDAPYREHEYTHAESNYLQVASETGLVGLSIALLCILMCAYWCIRGLRISRTPSVTIALLGLLTSLVANTVHSLFDFLWYIPGCMVVLILEMACACRLYQLEQHQHRAESGAVSARVSPRWVFAGALMAIVSVGSWMAATQWPVVAADPHWRAYRILALDADAEQQDSDNTPEDETEDDDGSSEQNPADTPLRRKLRLLLAANRCNPRDAGVQLRLMLVCHALFDVQQQQSENIMPLGQIRDAAFAAGFQSQDEMNEWLDRAFGANLKCARAALRYGLRGLRLNPLQFHGYLHLSELGFLAGAGPGFEQQCVAQAMALAPYESQVLFVAGRDAWLRQEFEPAIDYWKKSFHRSIHYQQGILRLLANSDYGQQETSQTDFIVEKFDPDIDALERLAQVQLESGRSEDRQRTLGFLAQRLIAGAQSEGNVNRAQDWLRAAIVMGQLERFDDVEKCFAQALRASPSNYTVRIEFGKWLFGQRRGREATEQFRWCQNQRPYDQNVKRLIDRVQRGQFPGEIRQVQATEPADLRYSPPQQIQIAPEPGVMAQPM